MSPHATTTDAPHFGFFLLTAAREVGADLSPAFRLFGLLPQTRGPLTGWLCDRAAAADPVVHDYLTFADRPRDRETRAAVLDALKVAHPRLALAWTTGAFVLEGEEGYWDGEGFTRDLGRARSYRTASECASDLAALAPLGREVCVRPTGTGRKTEGDRRTRAADPGRWRRALRRCRVVPGLAWVAVTTEARENLEREVLLDHFVGHRAEDEEVLRLAARCGHPLAAVYWDVARRQGWDPTFCDELDRLGREFAPHRDPPGGTAVLPPLVGPYRVVCGPGGFWDGARWVRGLDGAVRFPAWNRDRDEEVEAARRGAEERTGLPAFVAMVDAHPAPRE